MVMDLTPCWGHRFKSLRARLFSLNYLPNYSLICSLITIKYITIEALADDNRIEEGVALSIFYLLAVFRARCITVDVALRSRRRVEVRSKLHGTARRGLLFTSEVKHVYCLGFQETHRLRKPNKQIHK